MASATLDRMRRRATTARGRAPWARSGDWLQAAILALAGLAPAVALRRRARGASRRCRRCLLVAGLVVGRSARRRGRYAATRGAPSGSARRRWVSRSWARSRSWSPGRCRRRTSRRSCARSTRSFRKESRSARWARTRRCLGIVPFVTGRRVIPIEANDLSDAPFVLVQSRRHGAPRSVELASAYERVEPRGVRPEPAHGAVAAATAHASRLTDLDLNATAIVTSFER